MDTPQRTKKTLLYSLGALALFCLVAGATIATLTLLHPDGDSSTAQESTSSDTPAEAQRRGDEQRAAAQAHEEKGETQAALDAYKAARDAYAQAGNDADRQGVELQITYMEQVLVREQSQ